MSVEKTLDDLFLDTLKDIYYAEKQIVRTLPIAPAYVFLASPQMSSYITGEILPIIGGYGGS